MTDIYSGSFLTITTTRLSDYNGGLFSNRWIQTHQKIKLPLETFILSNASNASTPNIYIRHNFEEAHKHIWHGLSHNKNAPLMSRAWCFQERLLSPRILYFYNNKMVFQYRTSSACECGLLQKVVLDLFQYKGCLKTALAVLCNGYLRKEEIY